MIGFDRPMTDLDRDSLDLSATGTLPVGMAGVTPDTCRKPLDLG